MINHLQQNKTLEDINVNKIIEKADSIFHSRYYSCIYHDGFYFYLVSSHDVLNTVSEHINEHQDFQKCFKYQGIINVLYSILVKLFNSTMLSNQMYYIIQGILNNNIQIESLNINSSEKNILKRIINNNQYIHKLDNIEYTGNRGTMANFYRVKSWSILIKEYKNIKMFTYLIYDLNKFIYDVVQLQENLQEHHRSSLVFRRLYRGDKSFMNQFSCFKYDFSTNDIFISLVKNWLNNINIYYTLDKPGTTDIDKDLLILSKVNKLYQDFHLFQKQFISIIKNITKYIALNPSKSLIVFYEYDNYLANITSKMLSVNTINKIPANQNINKYITKLTENDIKTIDSGKFITPVRQKTINPRLQMRKDNFCLDSIFI